MALIVEVLAPRGAEVRQRLRLERFPCTVGRQLDNDLVLDDPYVDPHHARFVVDEDGSLVLEDLGSVNRLAVPAHPRAERVRLAPGAEVTLGRTRLRVRDASQPLPPALSLHGVGAPDGAARAWYDRPAARAAAIVLGAASVAWAAWATSTERAAGTVVLIAVLTFFLLGLMWAGVWAVAGRAAVGQFRIVAHLAIVGWVAVVFAAIGLAASWVEFLSPESSWFDVIEEGVALLTLAAVVAAHLALASLQPRARRWRIGAIVAGLTLLITTAFALVEDDAFTDVPEFSSVIRQAPPRLIPTHSIEEFGAIVEALQGEVDALVSEGAP